MINRDMKKKINKRIERLKQAQKIDDFSQIKEISSYLDEGNGASQLKSKSKFQNKDKNGGADRKFGERVNKKVGFGGAQEDFDNMTKKRGRFKIAKGKKKNKGKGKKRGR